VESLFRDGIVHKGCLDVLTERFFLQFGRNEYTVGPETDRYSRIRGFSKLEGNDIWKAAEMKLGKRFK
jgi:hypothetical protein